ncbi:MAG: hypothetical protein PWP28_2002 [Oceanotoga sp.]|nr:hypothetical protein [Oceanotoga sp.]
MMNKNFLIFLSFIFIFLFSFSNDSLKDFMINDFNNGIEISKLMDRNLILMFSTNKCPACTKFKNEVLKNEEVQKWLKTEYIFVEILPDSSKKTTYKNYNLNYTQLFSVFNARSTPTFIFFDDNVEPIGSLIGAYPSEIFLNLLKFLKYDNDENIEINEFMEKNIQVNIRRRILNLKDEEIEKLLKIDPNTKKASKNLDKYINIYLDDDLNDNNYNNFIILKKE